jgi:polysaccharide deacetylase family protein (PEP-CTERM system associated)
VQPVLSIDVEEYFQVVNLEPMLRRDDWPHLPSRVEVGLAKLAELLDRSGTRATFFVLGAVAERNPIAIRRLAEAGHEIASHGFDHRRLPDLGPEGLDRDLERAEEAIGAAAGVRVRGYRAPYFSLDRRTLWAYDVLIDRGYTFDASVFPGRHPGYGMPGVPSHPFVVRRPSGRSIVELPIAVTRVAGLQLAGGGGYFRLYPYRLTRFLIRRLLRRSALPCTFYAHPWELDPDQPRFPLPWWRRWRQYQGLRSTEARLRRLLADFRFADVGSVLDDCEGELETLALEEQPVSAPTPPRSGRGDRPRVHPHPGEPAPVLEVDRERRRSAGS